MKWDVCLCFSAVSTAGPVVYMHATAGSTLSAAKEAPPSPSEGLVCRWGCGAAPCVCAQRPVCILLRLCLCIETMCRRTLQHQHQVALDHTSSFWPACFLLVGNLPPSWGLAGGYSCHWCLRSSQHAVTAAACVHLAALLFLEALHFAVWGQAVMLPPRCLTEHKCGVHSLAYRLVMDPSVFGKLGAAPRQ